MAVICPCTLFNILDACVAGVGKQALKAGYDVVFRVRERAFVKAAVRAVARGPGARGTGGAAAGEGERDCGAIVCLWALHAAIAGGLETKAKG